MINQRIPVVILCGGKGTRLKEETEFRPKPLVMVGDRPMVWHIMKIYAHYGFTDFILCLGYKGGMIREYFLNYDSYHSHVLVELGRRHITRLQKSHNEDQWRIWLIDTGQETMTGGRLKCIAPYLDRLGCDTFFATYGDGVANVNINKLVDYHDRYSKLATVTAVQPTSRFGELSICDNLVINFQEKLQVTESWINGGFFVLNRKVLNLIEDENTVFEAKPLIALSNMGELVAYKHDGFWQCMDSYRELELLNQLYTSGRAPWKVW